MGYKKVRDSLKKISERILTPIVVLLSKIGLTPNGVTWIGLMINIAGAYFVFKGEFLTGGLIILFASIFDMLDGALARQTNKKSRFGGFLDSITDRFSEGALFFALAYYYLLNSSNQGVLLCFGVIFFSIMVSYLRARAGGLKIDCSVGIMTRVERMILMILGLLIDQVIIMLWIIFVLSIVTVIQRFLLVNEQAKKYS